MTDNFSGVSCSDGITFNSKSVALFYEATKRILHKWLNKRGGKPSWNWIKYVQLITKWQPLLKPKIMHNYRSAKLI